VRLGGLVRTRTTARIQRSRCALKGVSLSTEGSKGRVCLGRPWARPRRSHAGTRLTCRRRVESTDYVIEARSRRAGRNYTYVTEIIPCFFQNSTGVWVDRWRWTLILIKYRGEQLTWSNQCCYYYLVSYRNEALYKYTR